MINSQFDKGVKETEKAVHNASAAVNARVDNMQHKASDAMDRAVDRTSDFVNRAVDKTTAAVKSASEQGTEIAERASDAAVDFRENFEAAIKQNPTASVTLAVAAGFVLATMLGSMWRTR